MFPTLQLGSFAIQVPGLVLLGGVWVGLGLASREARRQHVATDPVEGLILVGLIAGILGARVWYAVRFIDVYFENPLALIALNPATLAPLEGAATGLLAAWVYGQRKKLPLWQTLDILTPGLAVFMIFFSLANFASGDAFGAATEVSWGIHLWGAVRHPTQLYSAVWSSGVLAAVWLLRREPTFPGFVFVAWVLLASMGRLVIEGFRGDSQIVLGVLRGGQLLSMLLIAASLLGLHILALRADNRD